MGKLSELINLGKVAEEKLTQVGIKSPEELKELGSQEAFRRVRTIDSEACINMLCAFEGAIQGIRWHNLSEERKEELRRFYQELKGK